MSLTATFAVRRGTLEIDVDVRVAAGETLALVGPNGAGKSTFLQVLAGLLPIDRGTVVLDGQTFDSGRRADFVPPEARGIGLLFQDHLLFPHLRARDNVAFGLRARGVARRVARATADEWLARVGIGDLGTMFPRTLSGGQAQRVALARALASRPRLLLLDEPLAAIDASARLALRAELRRHLDAFAGPRIVVTHDAVDAFAFAARIAVLEAGRIVQCGTVAEICSRPRSRYVADLVGTNLFRGTAVDGQLRIDGGGTLVVPPSPVGRVIATVHPRAVALYRSRPDGTPRNVWQAPITAIETAGDRLRVQIGGVVSLVAEVTPQAVAELGLALGGEVWVALKATEIMVYPA